MTELRPSKRQRRLSSSRHTDQGSTGAPAGSVSKSRGSDGKWQTIRIPRPASFGGSQNARSSSQAGKYTEFCADQRPNIGKGGKPGSSQLSGKFSQRRSTVGTVSVTDGRTGRVLQLHCMGKCPACQDRLDSFYLSEGDDMLDMVDALAHSLGK